MSSMTPKEIVSELDRHIVGQADAKRAVAIALRNRWRRQQVDEKLRGEITPKNILMIGPTGVGKTEIARRLARLANAPFIKIEATKFTEVGYVGRDVEQIVRDLVEVGIAQTRERKRKDVLARGPLPVPPGAFVLWPAAEVLQLNQHFDVDDSYPGLFAFGSDGGPSMLAFDARSGLGLPVVTVPFIGLSEEIHVVAESFDAFTRQ